MTISSKFMLSVALFALAFTVVAALPVEDADSFEDGFLDVEETSLSTAMNMYLTCDNEFHLFVNGRGICSGNSWTTTYRCKATVNAGDVIALDGRDAGGPAAFIGVFNGVPTKPSDWRCKASSPGRGWNTNNFDDSSWSQAVSFGRNNENNVWRQASRGTRPNIPGDAQWLWTANNNNHNRVFCRYVPIKQQNAAATNVKDDVSGLNVQYYNLGGQKSQLPDFSTLKPSRTDVSAQINFPSTGGNFATSEAHDYVGAVWTGFINVPSSGSWELFLASDDGSKLFIGDKLIVNNDGLHGMVVKSGNIALGAGKHPLRVEFFENGGGAGIIMWWKGPGVDKAVVPKSALTRTEAAVVKHARDALDASKGDYKNLFTAMMKQIKSGLATMKTDAETEFQSITSKRNAVKDILASRIASAQEKEKAFSSATAALEAADKACTSAKNTAVAASATLKATTDSLNARNPIIEKELAVIKQLVDKVGELKSINLQESSGHEAARSSAYKQTRDMIESLQTFEDEAAPLSEMIEMAREHAEFTQPIVKLLKELEAKLLAERDSLRSAVASAQSDNTNAESNQKSTCEKKEAKRLEEADAKTQLTSANSARDTTQQEFNDLQKLWESTRTKTEAALQTYTAEMITLNSLESCAVQAVNPVRKSCWEIKSVHPDAPSGVYKIRGPSGEPLSVQCDMAKQGGGWTLAGVAIFGQHGKAGWNSESFLNQGSSDSLNSHWHMSSDFMNSLAQNGEYRVNCFESTNDYERLWKGVRNYKWSQTTSASSSSSVDGVKKFPTGWAGHHWGLTSGNNERDAVITSHSGNQWACAGNQGPRGEGYTGRGGRSNMRIWLR